VSVSQSKLSVYWIDDMVFFHVHAANEVFLWPDLCVDSFKAV
jgi:hypothetical protein